MNQKTNCDKGGYSRTLLLLFMFCFSPFEISTFQIVRPTPTNFVGKDSYDQGKFVYRNQIVNVDCVTTERKEGRCVCGYGGTFVFNINNNGNLQPTCVYKYSDVFGMIMYYIYKHKSCYCNLIDKVFQIEMNENCKL